LNKKLFTQEEIDYLKNVFGVTGDHIPPVVHQVLEENANDPSLDNKDKRLDKSIISKIGYRK
jgi:hypothetical protein